MLTSQCQTSIKFLNKSSGDWRSLILTQITVDRKVLPRVHLHLAMGKQTPQQPPRSSSPRLWITTWLKTSKVIFAKWLLINCPCNLLRCDGFCRDCEHCYELCTNMQYNVGYCDAVGSLSVRVCDTHTRRQAAHHVFVCVCVRALTCYDW